MTGKLYKVREVILGWLVANFLGIAVIGVLTLFPFLTSIHGIWASSLMIGLPIGFAQWIYLRRVAPISPLWILTISAVLILGLHSTINGYWGFLDDESVLSLTAVYTSIGLFVGLAQWLFLWRYFYKSLVWPLSSALGLGLGIGLILVSNLINQSGLLSIILVALMYTLATGFAMSWMQVANTKIEDNLVNTT
jgi:hypothetical protein